MGPGALGQHLVHSLATIQLRSFDALRLHARDDLFRSRELAIFVVLSLVSVTINEAIMWLGVNLLSFNYAPVKAFASAVVTLWNFISRKHVPEVS